MGEELTMIRLLENPCINFLVNQGLTKAEAKGVVARLTWFQLIHFYSEVMYYRQINL